MSLQDMNRKRQAQDLERNLNGVIHFLADKYNDFQQQCRVFNPKRGYSPTAVKEIKEAYKTITAKLAEARALQQMLRGKYKGYVQVNTQLQREVEELSLVYRKDYRFFELNHSAWEREQHVSKETALPISILSHLYNIYRESPTLSSLILCFHGDFASLRTVKERVALGERDTSAMEGEEIWFVLAEVKSPEDPILRSTLIESLLPGLHGRVKGVVVKLTTEDEVREEVLRAMRRALAGVKEGDIKIL